MDERQKYGIKKSIPKLVKQLDIETEVCDYLFSRNLLDKKDIERIGNNIFPAHRSNRIFLHILLHKANSNAYDTFISALDESHQWWLKQELEQNTAEWSGRLQCPYIYCLLGQHYSCEYVSALFGTNRHLRFRNRTLHKNLDKNKLVPLAPSEDKRRSLPTIPMEIPGYGGSLFQSTSGVKI